MLRARLEARHARLDQTIGSLCFRDGIDLRHVLAIHYEALGSIVPGLERAGAALLFPGWDGRSRLCALKHAMALLQADLPPQCVERDLSLPSEQEVWGALYAVEGSRLGNRVILRRVVAVGSDLERQATRFFADVPQDGATWPRLLERLEALDYRGEDFEAAALGATKVFDVYLSAAERQQNLATQEAWRTLPKPQHAFGSDRT